MKTIKHKSKSNQISIFRCENPDIQRNKEKQVNLMFSIIYQDCFMQFEVDVH